MWYYWCAQLGSTISWRELCFLLHFPNVLLLFCAKVLPGLQITEMIFEQYFWTQFWHRWGGTVVKFFKLIFIKRFYLLARADIFWREKKKSIVFCREKTKAFCFAEKKTKVMKTYCWEQGFPLPSSMPTVVCEFPLILSHDFLTTSSFLGW